MMGYTLVPKIISHRYSKKAALKDAVRSEMGMAFKTHLMNVYADFKSYLFEYKKTTLLLYSIFVAIVIHEYGSAEVHARQSDLPILDISPMSFDNVSVDSEVDENFNEIDVEHESNETTEDIDDIKVEERYNGLLKNISTNGKDGFEAAFMRCFVEDIYKSDFVNSALTCPTQAPFLPVFSKLVCLSTPVLTLSSASSTIVQPPLILIIIIGNEPLPSTSFPLSVSKPSSMGDIDYPYLLQYYKLAYLTPDLVHYQSSAASLFFANDQIIKLKSINNIGQVY
ncbi:hypothetical protein PHYBLDRAFT_168445 [Phycomyces blakesleeanus NRRL 1555(-)]|uniref:Uncharacterized protein n=1 Tax=Phycomyces blakesleeanus (strain ATCC 8743b / DSM 1359 / FGSC 10004 / NBRC 33097 / NRRL 1555) TaxID=763407 RepID=A0A162XCW0_PHYB8|nr:hypothetical protein PHYBLDRAFT_168445 [Phycomyces blakesleeanus NRRL 1555(-)]OAD74035.1 hypothetical protein PHYBLDRAFT_168445 [Phycomyces blakesleeanus NRRL 1555(-)]|eukprot:XP_018292075.1 hypothetical protein PHYBLDRAFT_168445 [Phycomyces blakesleeanus NRRL 1555(-)]